MKKFNYENTEIVAQKGGKVVRKVSIKKGRGHKSITKYHRGKKMYTIKKPIHSSHIQLIQKGKFIPGLFKDCKNCKTKKRRGGDPDYDIEMGPQPRPIDPYKVPADPQRYKQQELNIIREALKPIPASKAQAVFDGPTPEQRAVIESNAMIDEDPRFKEPFQIEELQIFKRGGKRNRVTRRKHGGKKQYSRKGGDFRANPNNNTDYNSESEDDMSNDNWSEEDLAELREIRNLIDQNNARFQELDDALYEIETMTDEEREKNRDREEELHRQMEEYARRDQELLIRLRSVYSNRS